VLFRRGEEPTSPVSPSILPSQSFLLPFPFAQSHQFKLCPPPTIRCEAPWAMKFFLWLSRSKLSIPLFPPSFPPSPLFVFPFPPGCKGYKSPQGDAFISLFALIVLLSFSFALTKPFPMHFSLLWTSPRDSFCLFSFHPHLSWSHLTFPSLPPPFLREHPLSRLILLQFTLIPAFSAEFRLGGL